MSLLTDLTSLASNAMNGNLTGLVEQVKNAMANGHAAESPVGKMITEKVRAMLPAGSGDLVQKLDDLIPDSVTNAMGITPAMIAYIKKALEAHQNTPATVAPAGK